MFSASCGRISALTRTRSSMDRVLPSEGRGCGFDPRRARHSCLFLYARVPVASHRRPCPLVHTSLFCLPLYRQEFRTLDQHSDTTQRRQIFPYRHMGTYSHLSTNFRYAGITRFLHNVPSFTRICCSHKGMTMLTGRIFRTPVISIFRHSLC